MSKTPISRYQTQIPPNFSNPKLQALAAQIQCTSKQNQMIPRNPKSLTPQIRPLTTKEHLPRPGRGHGELQPLFSAALAAPWGLLLPRFWRAGRGCRRGKSLGAGGMKERTERGSAPGDPRAYCIAGPFS